MKDPVIKEWLARPGGVVDRLRAMRASAGLRGQDIATELGWATSKVSKIEAATQKPSEADVRGWARVCGADAQADEVVALLARAGDADLEATRRAAVVDAEAQAEHRRLASEAKVVRNFQVSIVPGLLQVPGYALAVMRAAAEYLGQGPAALGEAVAGRMARQAELAAAERTGKRFEFLITEAALRWQVAPPEVMADQFDRLVDATSLPNVRLGVVPFSRPGTLPVSSFVMYDDLVVIETFVEQGFYPAAASLLHHGILDRLWADAAEGGEARALIVRAADALR